MSSVATQTQSPATAAHRLYWCTSAPTISNVPRVHTYPYPGAGTAADRRASTAAVTTGYSVGISRAVNAAAARLDC
jgi:hypothetical protein